MQEIWKDVIGYEGLYQVSNIGRVRSVDAKTWNGYGFMIRKGRILKTHINELLGYEYVTMSKDGKLRPYRLHRIVATAFIPNLSNKPEVNHKNENKLDNTVENLEWVTSKENANHGTRNARCGEKHCHAITGYNKTTGQRVEYASLKEAAACGYDASCINKSARKVAGRETHKGFAWAYVK